MTRLSAAAQRRRRFAPRRCADASSACVASKAFSIALRKLGRRICVTSASNSAGQKVESSGREDSGLVLLHRQQDGPGRPCLSMMTGREPATSRYRLTCRSKAAALVFTVSAMLSITWNLGKCSVPLHATHRACDRGTACQLLFERFPAGRAQQDKQVQPPATH